jgi:hypothetical protein
LNQSAQVWTFAFDRDRLGPRCLDPYPDLPPAAYVYSLRVNRILRGKAARTILIYETNDSGRATFGWVPGREYLLFLFESSERKGDWALDGCGNSGPLDKARTALSEITTIKTARGGGVIHGVLGGSEQLPFATVAMMREEAIRGAQTPR